MKKLKKPKKATNVYGNLELTAFHEDDGYDPGAGGHINHSDHSDYTDSTHEDVSGLESDDILF